MRLLTQLAAIFSLVILLGFAGGMLTQRFVIWPQAKALTDQLDRKEPEQVLLGFDVLRYQLLLLVRDYAYWTATYDYLAQPANSRYVADNLSLDTFMQGNFHFVVFKRSDNSFQKIVMTTMDQTEFIAEPSLRVEDFAAVMPDPTDASPRAPLENSGFMHTRAGLVVFAAVTVLQNDLVGTSPGVMLMGRFVDNNAKDEVSDTVKKKFDLQLFSSGQRVPDLGTAGRDNKNIISADLMDVNDQPLARISMALPPDNLNPWWSLASTVSLVVFLVCMVIAMRLMYRRLVLPIQTISDHLKAVECSGTYSARLAIDECNELGTLAKQCNSLLAHIESQHHRLEAQADALRKLSLHDALTQISNRRHFDEALHAALAHAQRQKTPLALIICDVDYFKLFNDTYGHQGGDKALQAVAEILLLARHRKTDLVARYGGEEFVVLLADTDEQGAKHVLANIQNLLSKANIPHASSLVSDRLTLSMGVVCMHAPFDLTAQELFRRADNALYQAKKNGRNRAEFWVG